MTWSWQFAIESLPSLLSGAIVTIQAAVSAFMLSLIGGLLLAIARRSPSLIARRTGTAVVQLTRKTPLLVQLYFWFFVLPGFGIQASPLVTGVLGIGLHLSSYTAEVYRAGLDGVPRGQIEAAVALNMPATARWRHVILPLAIPAVIPALGNYLVASFKETPLLATISVLDMLARAQIIGGRTFRYLEVMTLCGLLYFLFSFTAALFVGMTSRRFALRGTLGRS